MDIWFAMAGYYARPIFESQDRLESVAKLVTDERWPWLPKLARFMRTERPEKVRERLSTGQYVPVVERLSDPAVRDMFGSRSAKENQNWASFDLETGRVLWKRYELPLTCRFQCKGDGLLRGSSLPSWLTLVHDFAAVLEVHHGVISAFESADAALSDSSLMEIVVDGVNQHPRPEERERANYWRPELGGPYVRHPRWGNYLHPRHLEALGGLDRIRSEVDPALVEPVGDVYYVQLTEPDQALSDVAEKKRQLLERILEPILVPPVKS